MKSLANIRFVILSEGTNYIFKISETTVYICPFKTKVEIETIFSLTVTIFLFLYSLEKC